LFINREHLKEFCQEIKKTGLTWSAQARVNLVDEEIIDMVKDAGCLSVGYGVESGSLDILSAMKKAQTPEQIRKAIETTAGRDVGVKVQLLFGFPGETQKTINETVGFFDKLAYPPRRFLSMLPLPGSTVYNDYILSGKIPDELAYLKEIGDGLYGVNPKKLIINCTDFDDSKFFEVMRRAEIKMQQNYHRHVLKGDAFRMPKKIGKKHYLSLLPSEIYFRFFDYRRKKKLKKKQTFDFESRKRYYFWDLEDPAVDMEEKYF